MVQQKRDKLLVWLLVILIVLIIICIIGIFNLYGQFDSTTVVNDIQVDVDLPIGDLEIGNSPFLGDEDAPITIVEFSDYQCSFCSGFWSDILPLIESEYIDTGKVKFVFKDLPLVQLGHVSSVQAAVSARCAGEQGKYWEMHDKLFEGQQGDWGYYLQTEGKYFALEDAAVFFNQYAGELGLNLGEFGACISDSEKHVKNIQDDIGQTVNFDIRGTPSFVIIGAKKNVNVNEITQLNSLKDQLNQRQEIMQIYESEDGTNIIVKIAGLHPFDKFQQIIEVYL